MFLADDLNTNLNTILNQIKTLVGEFKSFIIGILIAAVVVWCIYVAVRLIIAHRNEERVDAKRLIKNLILGVVIMFVLIYGVPLLIEGLQAWAS